MSKQFEKEFVDRKITDIEIVQEKCLNLPKKEFREKILNKSITHIGYKGKWIIMQLSQGFLFLSLGMGGDLFLKRTADIGPDKRYQLRLYFDDKRSLYISFWWFGYFHYTDNGFEHSMTSLLGYDPLGDEWDLDIFYKMLEGKKGNIKSFLMDQHNIAGIGNVYIQDILFYARLHPLKKIDTLTSLEKKKLYNAIIGQLKKSADVGGLKYEKDLYGDNGGYDFEYVAYKKGKPCPVCNTTIEEIKTGATKSCICPACQKQ